MQGQMDRRCFMGSATALMVGMGNAAIGATTGAKARPALARVIIDNDFSGDPDGLVQLAHHLLCPSLKIPIIVGSHLPSRFGGAQSAMAATAKVRELLTVMHRANGPGIYTGAEASLVSRNDWKPSPATAAIVREAMRDSDEPLVYAAGAGLTELALAWLAEPRIGRRIKLIWIGGREHPGMAYPPPGLDEMEFNTLIDPLAAQIIFNDSDVEIWQVPRDAYRQMLFTAAELEELGASGPLGRFLKQELESTAARLASIPGVPVMPTTEAYVLGDSPLVTLTALMGPFQPDPSSSRYVVKPTPKMMTDGGYQDFASGRPMRLYTAIDSGLTIRDMAAKFRGAK